MFKKGFLILALSLVIFFCFPNTVKEKLQEYPSPSNITEYLFSYQSYDEIIELFKEWEKSSPDLIEVKSYGKSSEGKDLYYVRVSNEYNPGSNKTLVTASIHGNEPLSTSVTIGYIGKILSQYGHDEKITKLVNDATIYYVPVVSPDSYPSHRNVDSVDPNRNFPTLKNPNKISVPPVKSLQDLFLTIKPNSVFSAHTYGRMYLTPWGDSVKDTPNQEDYDSIVKEMGVLSNYKVLKASQLYKHPIYGTEIDYYYRNGSFAIVSEFGTHQKKPTLPDTKLEFERTIDSFIYFLEKSPNVKIEKVSGE